MARTGVTNIKFRNNGTPLGNGGFNTIDLTGTLSATDEGNGIVNVAGTGGGTGTNIATDIVTGVQSGSNVTLDLTTLSHTFVAIEVVFASGQALTPATDWTRSGNTITVIGANSAQVFQVQYTY